MPLVEQMYCTQQINVPPRLPLILKQFCKAAIRTQPYDLLRWSSTYFRALADGEEPPVKLRLEYPPPSTESGLTLGFFKVLLRQFGDYNKTLPLDTIARRWDGLCLDHKDFDLIISIGKFHNKCQVKKFLSIAVGLLGNDLHETMILICELFTHEPEGGSAMIPIKLFMEMYSYLADLECDVFWNKRTNLSSLDTTERDTDNETKNSQQDSSKSDDHYAADKRVMEPVADMGESGDKKYKIGQLTKHPRVPGIGPRISSKQIAAVGQWMNECAELQEDMVGPRNIRHFQCPALDKYEIQS